MDNERIELVIEGLPEKDGRMSLGTFVSQLQSLSSILNRLDRNLGNGKSGNSFEVVVLSYASPYRIAVQPTPNARFTEPLVVAALDDISATLASKGSLAHYDPGVLESIRALAKPVGKAVKSVTLLFGETNVEMNSHIVARIDEALAVADQCEGFTEGMLEQINLHDGANMFHIYSKIGAKKVACHFPPMLVDKAIAAVGQRVEVSGTLRYRAGASFPHEIMVTVIEACPLDADPPNWQEVRGLAPDASGDLSSEDFVLEQRDAWP